MAVAEVAQMLADALKSVPGVRVHTDMGATIDPPAVVLGPPALIWEGACLGPTSGRFLIYVVVPADERALTRLWELVPVVADAVDGLPDVAVTQAMPGRWSAGGSDLPSYEITTEVSL